MYLSTLIGKNNKNTKKQIIITGIFFIPSKNKIKILYLRAFNNLACMGGYQIKRSF
jgi:hypothetical protein